MWHVISFKEMYDLEKYLNDNALSEPTHHLKIFCNVSGHYVLVWWEQ